MKTKTIATVIGSILLLGCGGAGAQDMELAAAKGAVVTNTDELTGVRTTDLAPALKKALPIRFAVEKAAGVSCSITVPASVNRGQTFTYSVSYSPCQSGGRIETVTFRWPSTLDTFTENTVREKVFFDNSGCVSSSFESVVAPTAGAITGSASVTANVRGETFDCTASTTMTVN